MTEMTEMTTEVATEVAGAAAAGLVVWRPRPDLPDGQSWLGVEESGRPLVVGTWGRDGGGRVVVQHVQVIGRRGSGRSATVRALLGGDLVAGREALVLVDGTGMMSGALARWSVTGTIARTCQEWADAVSLAYAIMQARLARSGGGSSWSGPSPSDPILTLLLEDGGMVGVDLPAIQTAMVAEMTRLGPGLGVRVVQTGRGPGAEDVIGGDQFRSRCRIVLGHAVADVVPEQVTVRGAGVEGVSLSGLCPGQVVVVAEGRAVRGQVAWVSERALAAAATRAPRLGEADLTGEVEWLLDVCRDPWQMSGTAPVAAEGLTLPVPAPAPAVQEWAGVPADPRWDPYRLRVLRPRWWRPWWTACVDYVGGWVSHGDQTIIVVRSRDRARARARAVDTLIGHCRWLAGQEEYAAGTVPVVWQGAGLVPVAHLAGRAVEKWPAQGRAASDTASDTASDAVSDAVSEAAGDGAEAVNGR